MIIAIVPVHNEECRVGKLLNRLLSLDSISKVFVILNGSNKRTQEEVAELYKKNKDQISLVCFSQPLGIDVPRAIGAKLAFNYGAKYALFVDGDLIGEITKELSSLITITQKNNLDLALTNCYPLPPSFDTLNEPMFFHRKLLNIDLGLYKEIGIATPSHGPHIVSRKMLALIPWRDYCVPPTLLAHAVLNKLKIGVASSVPHNQLGSSLKPGEHNQLIIDTIVGDCLEAICMTKNVPRSRHYGNKLYIGYHQKRRFDLLCEFLAGQDIK